MVLRKSKTNRPRTGEVPDTLEPSTRDQGNATSIMDLPKELLVEIIAYTLVRPTPITLREPQQHRWATELANLREVSPLPKTGESKPARKRTRRSPLLRILLVCKEFYFAGTEAFYGKNVLHFDDVGHFLKFKARLGERQRACVSNVVIDAVWQVGKALTLRPSVPRTGRVVVLITCIDPLQGLPKLQSVTIANRLNEICYWFVAASKARKAEAEIREKILAAWKSNAKAIRFAFPEDWGVVKDK